MIDPLSLIPLHVETFYDNKEIGELHTQTKIADATAFIFSKDRQDYLITNWHVVSGRDPETGKPKSTHAAIPNVIDVWFHGLGNSKVWMRSSLSLLNWKTDEKLWKEHPRGREVDLIALPLKNIAFKLYPLDPDLFNTEMDISPSESVSIIGFPFGLSSAGAYPIWKAGHVASDIDENYDGKPVFLVDGTFKHGMSGSPVFARRKSFKSEDKSRLLTLEDIDKFLGVFSGTISTQDSDVGMVWKPEIILEIIDNRDEMMKKIVKYKVINLWDKE